MAMDGPCLIGPAAALLVIDVQGRFAEIAFDAQGILSRLASLIARARLSVPVVYTRQRFDDQIPPIQPLIRPASADTVIDKGSSDAFLDTGLDDWLAGRGIRTLVVTGFATEACVDSTARSALSHGCDLVLVSDCHTTTADRGPDPVTARDVVAHYNATFQKIHYGGRRIMVAPEHALRFE